MIFPYSKKKGLFPYRKQAFLCLSSNEDIIAAINILEDPIHVTTISQHLCWNTLYIVFYVFDFYARPRV